MKEHDIRDYLYDSPEVLFPSGRITEKAREYSDPVTLTYTSTPRHQPRSQEAVQGGERYAATRHRSSIPTTPLRLPGFSGGGSWAEPLSKTAHRRIPTEELLLRTPQLHPLVPGPLSFRARRASLRSYARMDRRVRKSRFLNVKRPERSRPLNRLSSWSCSDWPRLRGNRRPLSPTHLLLPVSSRPVGTCNDSNLRALRDTSRSKVPGASLME